MNAAEGTPRGDGPFDQLVVRQLLRPNPELECRVRGFIEEQLHGILPSRRQRGVDWYYDAVVLGGRAVEALRVLRRHWPQDASGPLVDIGCGMGSTVMLANRLGMPAVGIEPGSGELSLAAERWAAAGLGGPAPFVRGGGERLPLATGSASAVLLHDVLEHVAGWKTVLREATRVLMPGGLLYVKGPSYAVRFLEPHYRVPWLPLLPRPVARAYLSVLGRRTDYYDAHIHHRRRGEVLAELRRLGLALSFPRQDKLRDPSMVNRSWVKELVRLCQTAPLRSLARLAAENPLQSTIDVLAHAR